MRFPRSFILCLLPAISLAVKKDLGSRFEDYHAKSLLSAPLKLDDASYDELTGAPRNFSVVVLLTALEARFGCQLCRDFQPEWDLIGRSWARGDKDGNLRVLYGTLDFLDGKGTFQKVSGNCSQRCHLQSLLQMLIVLDSSCCRLLQFCSSSHKRSARTPRLTVSPFDMTSQRGE
jgi:hypothetical protein